MPDPPPAQHLVQQALEQEDFLGRGSYERRNDGGGDKRRPYRNGFEEGTLRTAEGEVKVRARAVRDAPTRPARCRWLP